MAFATTTVHGLSCDVYFGGGPAGSPQGTQQRIHGDVTLTVTNAILDLTANDVGNIEPVNVLRRGDTHQVTIPFADATGSGVQSIVNPFNTFIATGPGSGGQIEPVAKPGDNYLNVTKELRLVFRDGSATWIFPTASVVKVENLVLAEEKQMVQGAVFQCFRSLISGQSTPFIILSGQVVSGGY